MADDCVSRTFQLEWMIYIHFIDVLSIPVLPECANRMLTRVTSVELLNG